MTIAISAAKRMKEGLYAQVSLSGDAKDCLLVATAATAKGRELPVRVLRGEDEGEWILSLAPLSVTQVVSLAAIAWDGTVVEEQEEKFNPLSSRLPSLASIFKRRGLRHVPQIADAHDALGEWEVTIDRLIATKDGADVCHGRAVLRGAGTQSVEGALQIRVLNAHGEDAATAPWICLYDQIAQLPQHPGFFERCVEFSLRVPSTTSMLVVWVLPQEDGELPSGFVCLEPRVTSGMRTLWKTTTKSAAEDEAYDSWFTTVHAATQSEIMMQQDGSFDRAVSFSLVSVVRSASAERLREMVDAVLEQSYGHLELVLVNAAPDDRKLASVTRGLELADARVRTVPLGADFGDAAATSAGIDAATGEFVCLLGEGDLLAPDALWCLEQELIANPDADLLYTDEDRIERGHHVKPFFKPDWDYDLLMGLDYVGGLLAVRANLLREMPTMDRELDGAQSYYLTLFASTRTRKICHVPRVLYHVRSEREAVADGASSVASGLVALRRHLAEREIAATVRASTRVPRAHEVSYELPEEPPLVTVIIPNRDGIDALDRCLRSLRELTSYENYEVIVVEQGSVDPATFEYYRQAEEQDSRVRTVFRQGGGLFDRARLVNFGAMRAKGSYLLMLAPDVEITDAHWMERLVSLCARGGTGAAGVRLLRADGTIASTGAALCERGPVMLDRYRLSIDCAAEPNALLHTVTCASGACLMVDAQAFAQVKGMSDGLHGRFADADLCLRLRGAGQRVVIDPQVTLTLHRSFALDDLDETRVSWLRAVGRLWDSWPFGPSAIDPTLNPNLEQQSPYRTLYL